MPAKKRKGASQLAGPRGRKSWALMREVLAQQLPPGPETLKDVVGWPLRIVTNLMQSDRDIGAEIQIRIHTLLLAGLIFYTDYSGMDYPREALLLLVQAMCMMFGWSFPEPPVSFVRHATTQTCRTRSCSGFRRSCTMAPHACSATSWTGFRKAAVTA